MAKKNNEKPNVTYEEYLEYSLEQLTEIMSEKMFNFCELFLTTGNATESAIKSGYSEKTANRMGAENLTKPVIKAYIFKRSSESKKKTIASANEVLEFFTSVMRGEETDQFGLDCALDTRVNAAKELFKRYRLGEKQEDKNKCIPNINIVGVKNGYRS